MSEKAKLSISTNKKGSLIGTITFENGSNMTVPPFYKLDNSLNGKECEVLREKGAVKYVSVEGKELPSSEKKPDNTNNTYQKNFNSSNINNNYTKTNSNNTPFNKSNNTFSIPDSFDKNKSRLPKDTRELNINDIDNFSIKLNKAVRFNEKDKAEFFKKDRNNINFQIKANFGNTNFKMIVDRQEISINSLVKHHKSKELKNDWRMIIGLGGASVYETSMTLHHIYGIPYIPASTIKGITRSWIISELFDNNEKLALKNEDFCLIFGSPKEGILGERQGNIIFFDSFPTQKPEILPDIMNPHFGEYYQGTKPPVDYLPPLPISFLTIKEGSFKVFIGTNNDIKIKTDTFKKHTTYLNLLDFTFDFLYQAFSEHGIGAKTAVGYGYFD